MRSVRTRSFREQHDALPASVRRQAENAFRRWRNDSSHPSLSFKRVDDEKDIWSVRVSLRYRALCRRTDDDGTTCYVWFWIGPHALYERLLNG